MSASPEPHDPASFLAAATALNTISEAVRTAHNPPTAAPSQDGPVSVDQALTALLLLRELRDELARWEPGLIETARAAGSSWADLAHPWASPAARPPSAATCAYAPEHPAPPANSAYRPLATAGPPTAPLSPGPGPTPPSYASSPTRSPRSRTSRLVPARPWPGSPTPSPTTTPPTSSIPSQTPTHTSRPHTPTSQPASPPSPTTLTISARPVTTATEHRSASDRRLCSGLRHWCQKPVALEGAAARTRCSGTRPRNPCRSWRSA